jgi:hypothetical protein
VPSPNPPVRTAPRIPTCPNCGTLMDFVRVEPNPNYMNLDLWSYSCDCGASVNNFIAHEISDTDAA